MGHISRVCNLASSLKHLYPEWNVIVVSGDKKAFSLLPDSVEFVKLPSFTVYSDTSGKMCTSPGALHSYSQTSLLRRNILETLFSTLLPDVVVIEHLARGHGRELSGIIRKYKLHHPDSHFILGLRGIMGTKQHTVKSILTSKDLEYIKSIYDTVFIYSDKNIIDFISFYDPPSWFRSKLVYTGYILPKYQGSVSDNQPFGKDYIGIGLGSGIKAEDSLKIILDALHQIDFFPHRKVIVTGPKFIESEHVFLKRLYPDFTFISYTSDYASFIEHAAFFIGYGGYNTVATWLKKPVPALFITRDQSLIGEQDMHINALANLGLCLSIKEDDLNSDSLLQAYKELSQKQLPSHNLSLRGSFHVSYFINKCTDELPDILNCYQLKDVKADLNEFTC